MIMSIDQSLRSTGVCVFDDDDLIYHQIIKTERNTPTKETIAYIIDSLELIASKYNVKQIICESLALRAVGRSAKCLAGLFWVLDYKFDTVAINIKTVKKYATGNGNASKEMMIDALPCRINVEFSTYTTKKAREDMADAYWIYQTWRNND